MSKVLFVGGREKGFKCLRELVFLGADIVWAYILKEDEHEKEQFSQDIERFCKESKISYTLTRTVKEEERQIKVLKPDLIVVSGWRTMIPDKILKLPKYGSVAFHESLLPKYRGFAPINWAVINGERYSGVTLFYLDSGVDSGDIIDQIRISISGTDSAFDIYKKTIAAQVALLKKYYPLLIRGKAPKKKQDILKASYACARTPEDGRIDWSLSAKAIYNLIRGLSDPYPGAFCFYKGRKIIIQKAILEKKKWVGVVPGRIVSILPGEGVEVLTGNGSIFIKDIVVGSKEMNAGDYFDSIRATLE